MPDERTMSQRVAPGDHDLRRALGRWIWSVLLIVDALMLTRRFSGSFTTAAPEIVALISTIFVAVASSFAWTLQGRDDEPTDSALSRFLPVGISLGISCGWVMGISHLASATTIGLLAGVVLMQLVFSGITRGDQIVFAIVSSPIWKVKEISRHVASAASACESAGATTRSAELQADETAPRVIAPVKLVVESEQDSVETEADEEFESTLEQPSDGNQTLWLSRRISGEAEVVEGWVRIRFAAGQRETQVHVAFCPPLAVVPEIETEDLDGADLEVRVAAVFPFGARLSVRRGSSLVEDQANRVGFVAVAMAVPRAA